MNKLLTTHKTIKGRQRVRNEYAGKTKKNTLRMAKSGIFGEYCDF
jgi:hypothetical protein